MWQLLRIICIFICWLSCLYESTPFATVAAAVPFEYFEDHEQLSYDLDTEQSKAKYDTRLLSEQLLKDQNSAEIYNEPQDGSLDDVDDEDEDNELQPRGRAASCHTGGRKYTHGQKVPRADPCEVCLCMDGEIFCWWEKCSKKRQKITTVKQSTSNEDKWLVSKGKHISTTTTTRTTTTMHQQQHGQQQKQHWRAQQQHKQKEAKQRSTKISKKKFYHEQQPKNEQQLIKPYKQQQQLQQQQQQQQQQQHHPLYAHKHTHMPTSNKILSFPENLPSVLYHDYKTEEHQHHQHQHHQQHLKHQQQQQQQQQKHLHERLKEHQQEKKQSAGMDLRITSTAVLATATPPYVSTNNDNLNDEAETDSDILPEPPTKKPKLTATSTTALTTAKLTTTTTATATATATATTRRPADCYGRLAGVQGEEESVYEPMEARAHVASQSDSASDNNNNYYNNGEQEANADRHDSCGNCSHASDAAGTDATSAAAVSTDSNSLDNNTNTNRFRPYSPNADNFNSNYSGEEDQDNAFHRWLVSAETANKNSNNNNSNNNSLNSFNAENDGDAGTNVDLENRTIIDNMTTYADTDSYNSNNNNGNNNNNNNSRNQSDKIIIYTTEADDKQGQQGQNAGSSSFFRSSYNDYSNEFNGSVVNIDIMLTAAEDPQQQPQQSLATATTATTATTLTTTTTIQQLNAEQTQETVSSIILQQDLISNASTTRITSNPAIQATAVGNAASPNSNVPIMSTTSPSAVTDNLSVAAQTFETASATTIPPSSSSSSSSSTPTALSPDRQCNVMGTLYKIGDVLPQDTGNCLQCVCIDGSTSDDTPRVTCSPHNCPPLVLPDLFDATGY